ncbi:Cof-type HAD-IIB family hydrolase [Amphibacillus sp. MSJ-3]|uniref:Cof-type HAD-IIB family hydrolase n=1 Tax=Amphibacillus sp. MSJ-3 TaxID=2841505 RepID=UPI001C0F252D|nr:Cof-type HAD-IIB family hydrolase [Amphibacillus sp. MSJ-3]MBU5595227.1 Cof-type HAD-IIB family hydrolase [Amphibacillus sp. MSJ-3]
MKNKKHLIALDLDGTLLTDEKTITNKSKQVLQKAREAGHIVVIATGRPHRASLDYYEELNLNTPMINFNGAYLHHPSDSKWEVLHSPLPIRTAKAIIQTCYDLNVRNLMAEVIGDIYIDQYDKELLDIFHIDREENPIRVGSLKNQLNDDPTSLIIYPEEEQVEQLRQNLTRDHAAVIEHRNWGAPWNMIEIVRKGMNKGVALDRLATYFQIDSEHVMAFGDEDNDLEMIEYAGVGVAMGNAITPLKEVAKYETRTNQADGVAVFIEDYLQLK